MKELTELRKSKYGKKDQPRTIVCKLLSYKDKVKVLQNCTKLKIVTNTKTKIFVKPCCSTEKSSGKR